jgi:hypothetical protein
MPPGNSIGPELFWLGFPPDVRSCHLAMLSPYPEGMPNRYPLLVLRYWFLHVSCESVIADEGAVEVLGEGQPRLPLTLPPKRMDRGVV